MNINVFNDDDSVHKLVQRLDMAMAAASGRVVVFISAQPGEGTSSVARDYALSVSPDEDHRVLLLDAGRIDHEFFAKYNADPTTSLAEIYEAGKSMDQAMFGINSHVFLSRWQPATVSRAKASKLISEPSLWKTLRKNFGTVVVDAPSFKQTPEGISFAAQADATVIVVEAEKTRQPVIENLRNTLTAAGAKIAGVVLNKRRFYIPHKVYQNM